MLVDIDVIGVDYPGNENLVSSVTCFTLAIVLSWSSFFLEPNRWQLPRSNSITRVDVFFFLKRCKFVSLYQTNHRGYHFLHVDDRCPMFRDIYFPYSTSPRLSHSSNSFLSPVSPSFLSFFSSTVSYLLSYRFTRFISTLLLFGSSIWATSKNLGYICMSLRT